MTNSYDVDHGLSQDEPGPLGLEAPDDTPARTGNTARDQEMYAAGIRTGEENAKHNAAIRGAWLPIESAPKDGTPVLLFARHIDAEASTRVVGAFNPEYGWIAQSYVGQTIARLIPSLWAELLPFPQAAPASPVSTVEQGNAADRSATHGMTLGERIAHVGGRTNAQGYIEFGSPMAVDALIQHVLRDIECTRQDDDGAYQARYRLPGGQWSSWGHVVCGVKGHEQELRFLPDGRRPAPAAGDALAIVLPAKMPKHESDGGEYPSSESYKEGYADGWNDAIDAAIAAQRKGDA